MRTLAKLFLALLLLSSCIKFKGNLDVDKTFTFYHETRGKLYKRVLPSNRYQASFQVFNNNSVELIFDTNDGRTIKTTMYFPNSTSIPRDNGEFMIPENRTAQNYDIHGSIRSKDTYSKKMYRNETCHEWVSRRVCRVECGPRGCGTICRWQQVREIGRQDVEYKLHHIDRYLNLAFNEPGSTQSTADFSGKDRESTKEYSYQGRCIINGRY